MDISQLPSPRKRVDYLIEYGQEYMNNWELEFVDSMDILLSNNKFLSPKQARCLTKLHRKIEGKVG